MEFMKLFLLWKVKNLFSGLEKIDDNLWGEEKV